MRAAWLGGLGAITVIALSACSMTGSGGDSDSGATNPDYPKGQITINSPFDPGGGIDLAINTLIKSLTDEKISDAQMRLSNIPGGSGLIAAAQLASDNDGDDSTLLLTSVSTLSASIQNPTSVGLDKMTPLGGLYAEYSYVYVPKDSPFQNLGDMMDAIKKDPGSVAIGGGSLGSADNMVMAELAKSVGVDFSDLAYLPLTGDENAANLLGGQVDVSMGGPDLLDLVDSGDVRVLAVSAPERLASDRVKDIPTMTEEGYQVDQANWRGLFGPPNMPQYAIDYWNDALQKLATSDAWKAAADKNVWDITGLNKDDFKSYLDDQTTTLTGVLTDLGLVQ